MQPPFNSTLMELYSALNQLSLVCANCKREASSETDKSTFKLCSGCYQVHYCNRDCQLADRKNHKALCKTFKTNNSNSAPPTILRDDFRSLLYYCSNGDLEGIKSEVAQGLVISAKSNENISSVFNITFWSILRMYRTSSSTWCKYKRSR